MTLSYFSLQIDNKLVLLTHQNNIHVSAICGITKNNKAHGSICYFCNNIRNAEDIMFISNTANSKRDGIHTIGVYSCAEYAKCNRVITDTEKMMSFMMHGK